jgi:hypothetical protein
LFLLVAALQAHNLGKQLAAAAAAAAAANELPVTGSASSCCQCSDDDSLPAVAESPAVGYGS